MSPIYNTSKETCTTRLVHAAREQREPTPSPLGKQRRVFKKRPPLQWLIAITSIGVHQIHHIRAGLQNDGPFGLGAHMPLAQWWVSKDTAIIFRRRKNMEYSIYRIRLDVEQLEKTAKRVTIYRYLRDLWRDHTDDVELTSFVMQQMVFYLHILDCPDIARETEEDEYQLYSDLLQEALKVSIQQHPSCIWTNYCSKIILRRRENTEHPIIEIKRHVYQLEQKGKRLPVYRYLRDLWRDHTDDAELTLLVMQQMIFYLELLEYVDTIWETEEDEYQAYSDLLQEVLKVGMQQHLGNKHFLWCMCYFLNLIFTYHFIFGELITSQTHERILEDLLALANKLFPDSVLFRVVFYLEEGTGSWQDNYSSDELSVLTAELVEWNLQANMADQEVLWWFERVPNDASD